jgi:hypothetical protein
MPAGHHQRSGSYFGEKADTSQDLQLPPAFCLPATAPLSAALEAAYEREFDQLPFVDCLTRYIRADRPRAAC